MQGVDARPFDLNETPAAQMPAAFDVAYSFEVAEHLPPALGDRLVSFLCETAPVVVITAARPGQGGTGHINEQPKSYWVDRFAGNGFAVNNRSTEAMLGAIAQRGVTAHWFLKNLLVYRRTY
jgi:hypothetical protein